MKYIIHKLRSVISHLLKQQQKQHNNNNNDWLLVGQIFQSRT